VTLAVVTGASRGEGKGIAIALGQPGANVYVPWAARRSVIPACTDTERPDPGGP
jgi:NAD(P)-dependent dehydrogenase (short-subunit alcohol dehydrogenase family)